MDNTYISHKRANGIRVEHGGGPFSPWSMDYALERAREEVPFMDEGEDIRVISLTPNGPVATWSFDHTGRETMVVDPVKVSFDEVEDPEFYAFTWGGNAYRPYFTRDTAEAVEKYLATMVEGEPVTMVGPVATSHGELYTFEGEYTWNAQSYQP